MVSVDSDVLEHNILIQARRDIVFAYFTDAEKLIRWKGVRATLDPRPGGIYRVEINARDIVRGTYLEVTPPERIVFTWGWEGEASPLPPGASTVEITFSEEGGRDTSSTCATRVCRRRCVPFTPKAGNTSCPG